ncbi:MAG: hypothetical protein DYG89_47985 [Caldilinea sp. CFX5]|nr:hypothetical protein [Caldilinea sp. CFX5]
MLVSAEIRWFYGGELPQATLDWFCYDELVSAPEERTDRYLIFPGSESVGMKVRKYGDKHNLEVKALRGGTETLHLPNGVTGRTECWVKWSYGEEPVAPLVQALLAQANGSVDVQKKRWLRKFSLDSGQPAPVSTDQRPAEGCTVELTQLHVQDRPYWTLALEAFGAEQQVRAHLWTVATAFLAQHSPPVSCTTVNSCSYPVWLANL